MDKLTFEEILISYKEGKLTEQSVINFIEKEIEYFKSRIKSKLDLNDIDNNHG